MVLMPLWTPYSFSQGSQLPAYESSQANLDKKYLQTVILLLLLLELPLPSPLVGGVA